MSNVDKLEVKDTNKIEEIPRDDDFYKAEDKTTELFQEKLNIDDEEEDNKPEHAFEEEDKDDSTSSPSFNDIIDEAELLELEKNLTDQEKLENYGESKSLKEEGNNDFKEGNFLKALELYTKALQLCPLSYSKDRSILYSNRAACKIGLNAKKAALDDCTKAIELNPNYIRALSR